MSEMFDFHSFPRLETERLILRETIEEDAPALFEYYRDPEFTQFISFDTHNTIEDTQRFIRYMASIFQQKESIRWGIQLKESNQLIGTAGLHFWNRKIQYAEIGYHIGKPFWGNGFATEVAQVLLDFGFHQMNLNRIEGRHNAGNDASGRVLEKVGFQREGIWRQRESKEGKFVDVIQYSILRSDYKG